MDSMANTASGASDAHFTCRWLTLDRTLSNNVSGFSTRGVCPGVRSPDD